jgi:hypothetical protein
LARLEAPSKFNAQEGCVEEIALDCDSNCSFFPNLTSPIRMRVSQIALQI